MDTEYIEIDSAEGLHEIADNPDGNYIITSDIDMTGVEWIPFEFSGVLDGDGHAILNLSIEAVGENTEVTYDGNMKQYDTQLSGFFSSVKNAEIKSLLLINEKINITSEKDCVVGGIAGYMENSTISECTILADIRHSSSAKMVGVGGAAGYGSGLIEDSVIDTTLVFTDLDNEQRNEQFMGGVVSAGYMDINNCKVTIDGYDSDQGYVHNGGLIGMYILYPAGTEYAGYINNNSLTGKITFFENNTDRRAYCDASIGEVMNWTFERNNNSYDFNRDEVFDYSVVLKPEMCDNPVYTEVVTPSICNEFGFTTYTCNECGHSYTDKYTFLSHNYGDWEVTTEPTYTETGIRTRTCQDCLVVEEEIIPILEPETTQETTAVQTQAFQNGKKNEIKTAVLVAASIVVIVIAVICIAAKRRKK